MPEEIWNKIEEALRQEIQSAVMKEISRFKEKFKLENVSVSASCYYPFVKLEGKTVIAIEVENLRWEIPITIRNRLSAEDEGLDDPDDEPQFQWFSTIDVVAAKKLAEKFGGKAVTWTIEFEAATLHYIGVTFNDGDVIEIRYRREYKDDY